MASVKKQREEKAMATKKKTNWPAKREAPETKSIFSEMKQSDMTAIDRKIHDLLISLSAG